MTVEVHIVTPVREVWTGDVQELIARGVDGEVGILGGHAPLLVQLAIGPLRMLTDGAPETRAVIDGGFLHVSTHEGVTRADVLAAYAELEQEIDVEAARARLADLEGRSIEDDDEVAKGEIAKAAARIKLAG
ncbi:MAG TPA: ATP synthase F1 subunit epsilon [Actinomycetota bacterium]|jgi:F-type H+-transporting ATPase subunit epsilon|nr:ATP synthase F1 subunit epsilon [Actinomycetota bacterium]